MSPLTEIKNEFLQSLEIKRRKEWLERQDLNVKAIVGIAASGKTLALNFLKEIYDLQGIETGGFFRTDIYELLTVEEMQLYTPLQEYYTMTNGLIPDNIVLGLMYKYLEQEIKQGKLDPKKEIYINGLPRTYTQAQMLGSMTNFTHFIEFYTTKERSLQQQAYREAKGRIDLLTHEEKYNLSLKHVDEVKGYVKEHKIPYLKIDTSTCNSMEEGLCLVDRIFKEEKLI